MRLVDLYYFNFKVDCRHFLQRVKKTWKGIKRKHYRRIIEKIYKVYEVKLPKIHSKFYACGGEYCAHRN